MITYCTKCKEPCQAILYDYGIGHYEYWGATGNDVRLEVVSLCCDAPVVDDNDNIVLPKTKQPTNLTYK